MSVSNLSGNQKRRMKSASRLYAVQALFQMEASNQPIDVVIKEFEDHRMGVELQKVLLLLPRLLLLLQKVLLLDLSRAPCYCFSDLFSDVVGRFDRLQSLWSIGNVESDALPISRDISRRPFLLGFLQDDFSLRKTELLVEIGEICQFDRKIGEACQFRQSLAAAMRAMPMASGLRDSTRT